MRFTKQDIYRLLGLEQVAVEHVVYHDSTGPGYLDSWLLLERSENIWQHSSLNSSVSKKQIIVSEPLEGRGPVSLFELQFFAALIAHCDVYFWPNDEQPFREARPISDPAEFWHNKRFQPLVAKQDIIDALSKESLSLDNVIIIDFAAYKTITAKAHQLFIFGSSTWKYLERNTQSSLDLSCMQPDQFHALADCVNPLAVKTITINPVNTAALNTVLSLFPHVENLNIRSANTRWLSDNLDRLAGLSVRLSQFMTDHTFTIPASARLNALRISFPERPVLKRFIAEKGAQVNSLSVSGLYDTKVQLGNLAGLNVLTLKNSSWRFGSKTGSLDFMSDDLNTNPIVLPPGLAALSLDRLALHNANLWLDHYIAANPALRSLILHFSQVGSLSVYLDPSPVLKRCFPCFVPTRTSLASLETFSLNVDHVGRDVCINMDLRTATGLNSLGLRDIINLDQECLPEGLEVIPLTPLAVPKKRSHYWRVDGHEYLQHDEGNKSDVWHLEKFSDARCTISEPLRCFDQAVYLHFERLEFRSEQPDGAFKIVAPEAKFIKIGYITINTDVLELDLSACPKLESLVLGKVYAPLTLTLNGLGNLSRLDIHSAHAVQIRHDPLTRLAHLRICAPNAATLRELMAWDLAPDCVTHFHQPDAQSFDPQSASSRIRNCIGNPLFLGILCAFGLAGSLSAVILFVMDSYGLLDNESDEYLPPPPPETTAALTSTSTTTAMSTTLGGVNAGSALEIWHIVLIALGATTLSALLITLYCMRAKLSCAARGDVIESDPGFQVDTNTGSLDGNTRPYPLTFHVYPEDGQRPEHARVFVKHDLAYERGKLVFSSSNADMIPISPDTHVLQPGGSHLRELMQRVEQDKNSNLIHLQGKLKAGVLCPLPAWYPIESAEDVIGLYMTDPLMIDCYYHPLTQQAYIRLLPGWPDQTINLFYELKKVPGYFQAIEQTALHQNPGPLLPARVLEQIKTVLQTHQPLAFLFDDAYTLEQKIHHLTVWFRAFNVADLSKQSADQLDAILSIITEQKGVCRHRSEAFMLLAHAIGCPVRIVANGGHMFCEVPGEDGYRRLDLSLLSGLTWGDNVFRQLERELREHAASELDAIVIEDPYYQDYSASFKRLLALKSLDSLTPLLNSQPHSSPLIILNAVSPLAFNAELVRSLNRQGACHLFIDSPQAFLRYLKPYRLKNGQMVEQRNGPLRSLLQPSTEAAYLLIDWSAFSHAQMASYQSLMDRPRMLFIGDEALELPDNLLVLGLIRDQHQASAAFLSRLQRWNLSEAFAQALQIIDEPSPTAQPIQVHLFATTAWREILFGRLHLSAQGMVPGEGVLIKAIREGRSLLVCEPPQDPAFDLLVHQINVEKRILSHQSGRMETVPDQVCIVIVPEDKLYLQQIMQASKLRIYSNDIYAFEGKRPIEIGMHNIHELYHGLHIDEQGQAHSLTGGLLADFEVGRDVFYIIGNITKSSCEALLEHAWLHYPDKPFSFVLSPGSEIEGYLLSESAPAPQPLQAKRIVSSSDPDYVTQQLAASLHQPMVIYTNESTRFTDLIELIYKDKASVNRFVYQRKMVLDALLAGQSIILSGSLSLELYLQLMPLCSESPHLISNGQRLELPGRLFLVLPQGHSLPFIQGHCPFTMADYRLTLPHANPLHLQQIEQFYQGARKLPHGGRGRPEWVRMNHARLCALLAALEDGGSLHAHNPVKGRFLYDYPRRSEEQAYLNVLGKYCFKPDDHSPVRARKLASLAIKTLSDLRRCVWTVLNCFNGADLQDMLGADLSEVVYRSGMPGLTAMALDRLFQACQRQYPQDRQSKRSSVEKSLSQVHHFLQNPRQKILMEKGLPGVGKTWTVRTLIGDYYEGDDQIGAWLADTRDGPCVWLGDEANMLAPGSLDPLIKGVCSGQRVIVYQGQVFHVAGNNKKMILTGNHESFPGRYYHPAIQDYAEYVYFEKPDDAFLTRHAQGILPANLHAFIPVLLAAYHAISRYNPWLPTSIRDMSSLSRRFLHVCNVEPADFRQALLRACVSEFACSIKEGAKRSAFIHEMEEQTGQPYRLPHWEKSPLIRLTPDVSTTREKAYIVDTLMMNLEMRFAALLAAKTRFFAPATSGDHKKCMVLEGEPGVGKSTLLRAILAFYFLQLRQRQAQGVEAKLIERELRKKIYLASGGSSDAGNILAQAWAQEACVILDESNIDPSLEALLLQYLSLLDKPGFLLVSSENDTQQKGRLERSPAALNRSQLFYFPPYCFAELLSFTREAEIDCPEMFVRAFLDQSRKNKETGMRHFFKCLQEEKRRQAGNIVLIEVLDDSDEDDTPLLTA